MQNHVYRIRKAFLIPFALTTAFMALLLAASFLYRGTPLERGLLTVLLLPTTFAFREALLRKVVVRNDGFSLHRMFRVKSFVWSDITHIGALSIRSKVYILLTTKKGFYIISNAYEGFSSLIRDFVEHLPSEDIEVEQEAKEQITNPTRNVSDPVAAWIAAVILAGLCIVKLTS